MELNWRIKEHKRMLKKQTQIGKPKLESLHPALFGFVTSDRILYAMRAPFYTPNKKLTTLLKRIYNTGSSNSKAALFEIWELTLKGFLYWCRAVQLQALNDANDELTCLVINVYDTKITRFFSKCVLNFIIQTYNRLSRFEL